MPKGRGDGGLTAELMLQSFHRVWARCFVGLGSAQPADWGDLDEDAQRALAAGFEETVRQLEEDNSRKIDSMAATADFRCQQVVQDGHPERVVKWEDLPPGDRLHWHALVRHTFNLLSFDPEEDGEVADHEDRIVGWFETKLAEQDLTEHERAVRRDRKEQACEQRQGVPNA